MSLYTYTHPVLILLLPYVAGFVFLLQFRDGNGDFFTIYVCVCVCVCMGEERKKSARDREAFVRGHMHWLFECLYTTDPQPISKPNN